jgi:hypothetical protein
MATQPRSDACLASSARRNMVDGSDDTFPTMLSSVIIDYLKHHTLYRHMVSRYEALNHATLRPEDILEGERPSNNKSNIEVCGSYGPGHTSMTPEDNLEGEMRISMMKSSCVMLHCMATWRHEA